MRAHQIMTKPVVTVTPDATVLEAANLMLRYHVSGLPVVDNAGRLTGIVSEGDFIRRSEIGTGKARGRWLKFLLGAGRAAADYVHEHGRKISEVMTPDPITITEETPLDEIVTSMERNGVKRLPVMRDGKVIGIVSRANLLQAVAGLARDVPDPTADDDHIRRRVSCRDRKERLEPAGPEYHRPRRHRPRQRCHHRGALAACLHRRGGERHRSEEGSRPSVLGRHHVRNVCGIARGRRSSKSQLGLAHG